jgi:hypothetical protein
LQRGRPRCCDAASTLTRRENPGRSLVSRQASSLARRVAALSPPPQLLVASPLRRALRTAELAFGAHPALPRLVSPLCRERLYHSSDVGRAPPLVAAEFPAWCVPATRRRSVLCSGSMCSGSLRLTPVASLFRIRNSLRRGFDALQPIWWHSNGDGDPLAHDPEPEGAHV